MPDTKRIYLSPPDTTPRDRELVLDAFDSNWLAPLGPHVNAFERELADAVNARYAVAVSSGTAAIHLALVVAGIRPGDAVITPTLTFVATANAIRHAGAEPVLVDCDSSTWTIDPELVDRVAASLKAKGRTVRAVVPVDVFGQCADYDALREVCQRHDLLLIADAAESLGATYRRQKSGSLADISCFSFNGNKIITTSGGGMVVTDNRDWADRVRSLASQARAPGPGYLHEEVGYNYRLSNLLAALGRGQLEQLGKRVARRREINRSYRSALQDTPGLAFMPEADYGTPTNWLTCVLVDPQVAGCGAEDLRVALEAHNIESRPIWQPLHLQPAHRSHVFRHEGGDNAPEAERIWRQGLCLPSGSSLTDEDLGRVVSVLGEEFERSARKAA